MRRTPAILPALLWLALVPVARAETPSLMVTFGVEPARATPGSEVLLRVRAEMPAGWHIYATKTANGTPTALALGPLPAGLELAGPLREPTPIREELEFVGPVAIHRGRLELVQPLRVRPEARGKLTVQATLSWQMCDDKNTSCLPNGKLSGTAELEVLAAPAQGTPPARGTPPAQGRPPAQGAPPAKEGGTAPVATPAVVKGGDSHVTVVARLEPPRAPPGGAVDLVLEATIVPGWHVYPVETEEGLPTRLELSTAGWLAAQGALRADEAPRTIEIPFVGPAKVHEGKVTFRQRLQVDPAAAGELKVAGKLLWQACDDKTCTDGSLTFALGLPIESGATSAPPAPVPPAPPAPGPQAPLPPPPAPGPTTVASSDTSGLLGLTLAAALLGLAMLLQPCNYPMIPITVSIFSKGRKLPTRQAVTRAGAYAVGIVLSFVLVAGVLTVALGAQGQGTLGALATNPWLNLGIAALFGYFAFSFFGYYELGLPAPLQRLMQLGAARRDAEGTVPIWSLFLMGFFFVLTSYTCGAPVVLALWAGAASQPHPLAIVYATFVFALVVATPYFVLSLVPGAVRSLPKSGDWFAVFKAVLGFLELGFALKFVRTADVTWGLDLLGRAVLYGAWTALSLATALYLAGYFPLRFPHDPQLRPPTRARLGWAGVFVGLAAYFGAGAAGVPLWRQLETFLLVEPEVEPGLKELDAQQLALRAKIDLAAAEKVVAARVAGRPLSTHEDLLALGLSPAEADKVLDAARRRVRWGPLTYALDRASLQAAQARSRESGRPVFLLFTGHACTNCQQMENSVLQQPAVVARLEKVDRVALFTDRESDPEEVKNRELLVSKFEHGVLPAFYLLDGEGRVLSAQIGGTFGVPPQLEPATQEFLRFLERGGLTAPAP